MPKRNLAWLLAILLVVTALWLLLPHGQNASTPNKSAQEHSLPLQTLENLVQENFVGKLTEEQNARSWVLAAQAKIEALDDPYSEYIGPDDFEEYVQHLGGKFAGIGIELDRYERTPTVGAVVDSSPAFDAGILPGDRILSVGDQDVRRLRPQEVARMMRGRGSAGSPGTPTVLTLYRPGADPDTGRRLPPIALYPEPAGSNPPVKGYRLDGKGDWEFVLGPSAPGIGYIRVSEFLDDDGTIGPFDQALTQLCTYDATRLILDLRNNPGGAMTQATKMVERFVTGCVIVEERGAHRHQVYRASQPGAHLYEEKGFRWPIVVLVNRSSASASEIVAGSLAFNGRAVLVGERTFGKGTMQEPIPIPWDTGRKALLKLTVAYLYLPWPPNGFAFDRNEPPANFSKPWASRPTGNANHVGGLKPTVEVNLSPSEQQMVLRCRREIDHPTGARVHAGRSTTRPDTAAGHDLPDSSGEDWPDELLRADRQLKTAVDLLTDQPLYESKLKKAPTTAAEPPDESP